MVEQDAPWEPIPRSVRKRLPKAPLLRVEWVPAVLPCRPVMERNRLAHAVRWRIGSLAVMHRAPWLACVARLNYPHLFAEDGRHG